MEDSLDFANVNLNSKWVRVERKWPKSKQKKVNVSKSCLHDSREIKGKSINVVRNIGPTSRSMQCDFQPSSKASCAVSGEHKVDHNAPSATSRHVGLKGDVVGKPMSSVVFSVGYSDSVIKEGRIMAQSAPKDKVQTKVMLLL